MTPEHKIPTNEPKLESNHYEQPSKLEVYGGVFYLGFLTSEMMISDEELAKERVPLAARDYCAHILVDLNRCRRRTLYMPFKCTEEKHEYEQCLYKE